MNSKVIVIPAKKKKGNSIKESEKKKLRVAAYARVSTDSDEQATFLWHSSRPLHKLY